MNDDATKTQPPVDQSKDATSIHLSYIRRDIDEIKKIQETSHKEIKASLEDLKHQYPSRAEFDDLKNNAVALSLKVENMETLKANQIDSDDKETRIRRLELWGGMALGGLALVNLLAILIPVFKK